MLARAPRKSVRTDANALSREPFRDGFGCAVTTSMLERLWTEFDTLPFPDGIPRDVRGAIDVEPLDDEASRCV